jgi:CBS domain-containing protein
MTSIQNILDRKCVEVVTICPSDKVKDAADRMQERIAALVVTNDAAFAGRMMPRQFNFMHRSSMGLPPTSKGALPGSWAPVIEPTATGVARSSGPTALPRHPTPKPEALIAALKQVKTGKFDADGDEL